VHLTGSDSNSAIKVAAEAITAEALLEYIQVLSSDEFEGRAPGSKGEDMTVAYLERQFQELGLEPGNPNGTYVQSVPLVGHTSAATASISAGGVDLELRGTDGYIAASRRLDSQVAVAGSEVVFVGYGVVAPEFNWDDYKGLDVTGKTILMLSGDPAIRDPSDPEKRDPAFFDGDAQTYYGRWTYKYEIATEKGAAAAVIVHETGPAGYPWEVVVNSFSGETFDLEAPDGNMGRVAIEAWMTEATTRELVARGGADFDELKAAAVRQDFRPVTLDARASFSVEKEIRHAVSKNMVAKITGRDAERANEYLLYSAHWDHLGMSADGESIFSGAMDNASETAGLLEVARAFKALESGPERTIVFLASTAEEQGLLGAKHYGEFPLYPLERTVANINIDGLNPWGRTRDIEVVGHGKSTLDDLIEQAAVSAGRAVVPDTSPQLGFFYRADQFEFAKQGVPALFTSMGTQFLNRPEGWGVERRIRFEAEEYHKPSDVVKEDWDLAGAAADTRLMFEVGARLAMTDMWPQWNDATEFKAKRDAMMHGDPAG
jgi:Zn-dependent M28 family amino/carboxypeptidase